MAALRGLHGGYLWVDVSGAATEFRELPESTLREFLGGVGLGARLSRELGAATIEPLDREAPLAFVFSPLVGSPLTTSAKFALVGRGALTGRFNDSLASSGFALAGKRGAGDALVISGQAERPSLLIVDDRAARLAPAEDLWGLTIGDTERELRRRFPGFEAAVIGPAGERGVRFATVSHDGRHAGRGGHGAVLGAKRLKAVLVRGTRRVEWARPRQLAALARRLSAASFGPATAKYRELGTAANLLLFNRLRVLPTRNFQRGALDGVEQLSPESLSLSRSRVRSSCAACTIGCEHLYGVGRDGATARVEYESLFALGPLCGVTDPEVVLQATRLCDQAGIDTISAGGTIAFAMECAERGELDAPWLRFGDGAALLRALVELSRREGLGDWLADGSRGLAERLGGSTLDRAPQVKGLELPGYEPRGLQAMAVGLAVGARGADHNRSGAYEADFSERVDRRALRIEDVREVVAAEDRAALIDSLILCKFLRGALTDLYEDAAQMLRLTTGWDVDGAELRTTAARIVAEKRRFNLESGWTRAEDTLPARLLREVREDDPAAQLTSERLAALVDEYYRLRGE